MSIAINARNLAAALSYMGADIETALLNLVANTPLDTKVRAELFRDSVPATLRYIPDRWSAGLKFICHQQPKHICAMHAVDIICQIVEDSQIVTYLLEQFSEYNWKELVA